MYNIRPTTKFQKDLKRVKKRGFDICFTQTKPPSLVQTVYIIPFVQHQKALYN